MTRARIAAAVMICGIVAVSAVLAYIFFLSPATIQHPLAPPPVAAARGLWDYDILLPTEIPPCLSYDAGNTGVVPDGAAINGVALLVTLRPNNTADCANAAGSIVRISEAPFFTSLSGNVSTISQGRMQFASVSKSTDGRKTELTLQWRCLSMMCRIDGTTSSIITMNELARMADSFQVARTSS